MRLLPVTVFGPSFAGQVCSMIKTGQTIAVMFALSAFAVAIVSGIAADVQASQVLLRSAVAMILCYVIGWGIGLVCEHVIRSGVSSQRTALSRQPPEPDVE